MILPNLLRILHDIGILTDDLTRTHESTDETVSQSYMGVCVTPVPEDLIVTLELGKLPRGCTLHAPSAAAAHSVTDPTWLPGEVDPISRAKSLIVRHCVVCVCVCVCVCVLRALLYVSSLVNAYSCGLVMLRC
jgi:hypothetical protein